MSLQLAKLLQQVLAFRNRAGLVNLRPADHALSVNDKRGALVDPALVAEDAVGLADRAVRPVVREQGKRYAAELFGPYLEAR